MAIYVIVHGGFFGGWRWRTVANMLRAAGHEAFTPTLTGLGERAHLASPQIGLRTHIQDVVGVLECEDLRNVILVGHSYASMVITGVAERMPERLARLVYLDTLIPQDGQSWLDLHGPEVKAMIMDLVNKRGDGWRLPLLSDPPRINPHPLKTTTDPLTIANPIAAAIPRCFIFCSAKNKDSAVAFAAPAMERSARYAREHGWWYREIPSDHGPEESMPRELTDLLLELS
jgi:pimeloyl-ACP methyl ester carboxylesterase